MQSDRQQEARQLEIDFPWAARRTILNNCRLPNDLRTKHGVRVRPSTAILVLEQIEAHHGRLGCFPTIETIAAKCQGISERTVRRAVECLEDAGFLIVTRGSTPGGGRKTVNHYAIVWTNLRQAAYGKSKSDQSDFLSRSNGLLGPINRTLASANLSTYLSSDPHPSGDPGKWGSVVGEFGKRIRSIKQLIAQAAATGEEPAEFAERARTAIRTATHPANAGKLKSTGGAIAWFLRYGEWPAAGIVDCGEADARQAEVCRQHQAARSDEASERQRYAESEARVAALEAEHGQELDLLDLAARRALLGYPAISADLIMGDFLRPKLLTCLANRFAKESG